MSDRPIINPGKLVTETGAEYRARMAAEKPKYDMDAVADAYEAQGALAMPDSAQPQPKRVMSWPSAEHPVYVIDTGEDTNEEPMQTSGAMPPLSDSVKKRIAVPLKPAPKVAPHRPTQMAHAKPTAKKAAKHK